MIVSEEKCAQSRTFPKYLHYEGKSYSCPRTQKRIYLILHAFFHILKYVVTFSSSVSQFTLHSLLRLLPKLYFKISTFQPNFLCSSSFNKCFSHDALYKLLRRLFTVFYVKLCINGLTFCGYTCNYRE